MADKIRVLSPAPVRHMPAKSRIVRTSYAPVYEDVELRELSRADAPEGPEVKVGSGQTLSTRVVDNAPWRPIGFVNAFADHSVGPDGATFRKWLEGSEETRDLDATDLGRCLEGSPLLARVPGQKMPERPTGLWNVARQGGIVVDARERMPGLVRDYMAANIALIDGMPFVRMPGPLAYLTSHHRRREGSASTADVQMQISAYPGGWTTNPAVAMGNLYRVDRLSDVMRADRIPTSRIRKTWRVHDFDSFDLRDDDVSVMLRESIRILTDNRPREGYPFEPERDAQLMAYSALGSVNAIDERDMPEAWRFVRDLSVLLGRTQGIGWVSGEARRIANYADTVAIQRVQAKVIDDPEDVAALSALAI